MNRLPNYLARPDTDGNTFGTLRLESSKKGQPLWVIEAEAHVVILAKRLFPGAAGRGRGLATFAANKRIFCDLVWLLHRWPLKIESQEAFDAAYAESCAYYLKREAINRMPTRMLPGAAFTGKLRPFQEEGLAWMLANPRTLNADEMGLGKTVQALAFLATEQKWPALIVVPPHLIRHWDAKIPQFLSVNQAEMGPLFSQNQLKFEILRGTKPRPLRGAHIFITHYLLLSYWRQCLKDAGFRRLIFDEAQELRHAGTKKYSVASELSTMVEEVIGLSGTPIHNLGGEIHNVLNCIDYHCLGDMDSFSREWCTGYGALRVEEPEVLRAHLKREGLMIRRRKEEVLSELPPKNRVVEPLDGNTEVFNELVKGTIELAVQAGEEKDYYARGRLTQEVVNQTRQATGIAKAPAAAAFVRSLVEAEEPTLVFAYHHAVVDILTEKLADFKPVRITGRENGFEKWEALEAFRTGKSNVCIISLRAAAGLDGLQERGKIVVFAELDWSPAIHSQGEDRLHRDGQRESVLAYYLVTDEGTDPEMLEALGLKVSQFVGIMGDKVEAEKDRVLSSQAAHQLMHKVVEKLRAKAKCPTRKAEGPAEQIAG